MSATAESGKSATDEHAEAPVCPKDSPRQSAAAASESGSSQTPAIGQAVGPPGTIEGVPVRMTIA
jgi:hypothetical protein